MNDQKIIPLRFAVLMLMPLIAVTFGGLLVYGTPAAFFYPATNGVNQVSNAPAVVYYGLSFVIALMLFIMKQGYAGYEFIAFAVGSVIFSISMKQLTPMVNRPIYAFLLPMLVFFAVMWLILRYIFLNPKMRQMRLLLFALLAGADFSLAFWMQFKLLKQATDSTFIQGRFMSGVMLFIFLGFGFSIAELILCRIEGHSKEDKLIPSMRPKKNNEDEDDESA